VLSRLAPQLMVKLSGAGFDMTSVIYPWGFTPVLAVGLFAGAFIQNRWHAVMLMLGAQFLGDLGIWALSGDFLQGFDPGTLGVYLAYPLCVCLGGSLSQNRSFGRVQAGSLLACSAFFLVTNFVVWALGRFASEELALLYPATLAGLMKCYVMGLPYAKEFISTPIFAGLLFSPLGVAQVSLVVAEQKPGMAIEAA
jgi:hypothetical protein